MHWMRCFEIRLCWSADGLSFQDEHDFRLYNRGVTRPSDPNAKILKVCSNDFKLNFKFKKGATVLYTVQYIWKYCTKYFKFAPKNIVLWNRRRVFFCYVGLLSLWPIFKRNLYNTKSHLKLQFKELRLGFT